MTDNDNDNKDSSVPRVNNMTSASFIPGQSYGSESTLGKNTKVIVNIQQNPKPKTKDSSVATQQDSSASLMSAEEIFQTNQTQIYNSIQDYYLMLKNSYVASMAGKSGEQLPKMDGPKSAVDSFYRQNFTEFVIYYKMYQYFIRPMAVFIGKMSTEMQAIPYRVRRSSGQIDWIPYLPNDIYILADHNYVTRTNDRQTAIINNMLIAPQQKSTVYVLGESYRGFWFSHPSTLELKGQMSMARKVDKDVLVEERIRWNSVVHVLEGKLIVFICDYKSVILMPNVDCKLLVNLIDVDQPDQTEELEISGKDLSESNENLEHILNVLHKQSLDYKSSCTICPRRRTPGSGLEEEQEKPKPEQPDDGKQPPAAAAVEEKQPSEPKPKDSGKDIKLRKLPKVIITITEKIAKISDSIQKMSTEYKSDSSLSLRKKSKPSFFKTRTSKYGKKRSKSQKRKLSSSPKSQEKSGVSHSDSVLTKSSELSSLKSDTRKVTPKTVTKRKSSKSKYSRKSKSKSKSKMKSSKKSLVKIVASDTIIAAKSAKSDKRSRIVKSLKSSLKSVAKSLYVKSRKVSNVQSKSKSLLKLPLKKTKKSSEILLRKPSKKSSKLKSKTSKTKSVTSKGSKSSRRKKKSKKDKAKKIGEDLEKFLKKTLGDPGSSESFLSRSWRSLREMGRSIFGSRTSLKSKKNDKKSLKKSEISQIKSMKMVQQLDQSKSAKKSEISQIKSLEEVKQIIQSKSLKKDENSQSKSLKKDENSITKSSVISRTSKQSETDDNSKSSSKK